MTAVVNRKYRQRVHMVSKFICSLLLHFLYIMSSGVGMSGKEFGLLFWPYIHPEKMLHDSRAHSKQAIVRRAAAWTAVMKVLLH